MSRKLYRRKAQLDLRVGSDGGTTVESGGEFNNLLLSNELYKDNILLSFCPALYGYKSRNDGTSNRIVKGYSGNGDGSYKSLLAYEDSHFTSDSGRWTVPSGGGSRTIANGKMVVSITNGGHNTRISCSKINKYIQVVIKAKVLSGGLLIYVQSSPISYSIGDVNLNITVLATANDIFLTSSTNNTVFEVYECSIYELSTKDLTQTIATQQPYLDKIAPAEKITVSSFQNDTSLIHNIIDLRSTDWTIELRLKFKGGEPIRCGICGSNIQGDLCGIRLNNSNSSTAIEIFNYNSTFMINPPINIKYGLYETLTITTSNERTLMYLNGLNIYNNPAVKSLTMVINEVFKSRGEGFTGFLNIGSYTIFNKTLSPSEIKERHAILSSLFPDIPSTTIGNQTWSVRNFEATVTPQGNRIPNITDNTTWVNSPTLYTNAYNSTTGTDAEKVYAGVKAAAMCCNYNNDYTLGNIYGKLYNWYAVKLLQMDIDNWNTANPTNKFGWRVPSKTDYTTIIQYLGTNIGGNLKHTDSKYWDTPNIGANNSTLFSAIGSGLRFITGTFNYIKQHLNLHSISELSSTTSDTYDISYDNGYLMETTSNKAMGFSLRLIKDN